MSRIFLDDDKRRQLLIAAMKIALSKLLIFI